MMTILTWYVLLFVLLWLRGICVHGSDIKELHDKQDAQLWLELDDWRRRTDMKWVIWMIEIEIYLEVTLMIQTRGRVLIYMIDGGI